MDDVQNKSQFDLEAASKQLEQFMEPPKVKQWKLKKGFSFEIKDPQYDYDISGLSCDEADGQATFAPEVNETKAA